MEIALILDRFDPLHGGLEHWTFQLASWLNQQRHRVHIVVGECVPDMAQHDFILHPLGSQKKREVFASEVERYVRQLQVDIVHDLGSGWYFDILQPQFGSRQADARQNLLTLPWRERWRQRFSRTPRRRLRELRKFEDRQYRSPGGRIIAVSEMTRADLQHFNHVPWERLSVIPNGVDVARFLPPSDLAARRKIRDQRQLGDQVILLLAAHNFRLKGVQTLLEALSRTQNEPLHALIVGHGEVEKYQQIAENLRVQNKVTFCGFVDDILDYYHAADICVHPTFYDPCSLATLEALSCGIPVITSRFNGASELMQHGVHGYILRNPASASELANAVRKLLNPATLSEMRRSAREAALRQTAEKCFERILASYGEVLESGQGRDSFTWK